MMTLSMIDTCVDTIESWVKARGWLVASLLCWKIFFLFFLVCIDICVRFGKESYTGK